MMVLVLTAWAMGAEPRRLLVLTISLLWPLVMVALIGFALWSSRRGRDTPRSALFCEAVSADLRAGSSLKHALASAMSSVGNETRPFSVAASLEDLASIVAEEFDDVGLELETTVLAAERSGAATADLFEEIGAMALARSEVEHEVRVATSPARATAFVFVAAPAAYLVARVNSGSLAALVASPLQRVAGLLGLGLFILGLAAAGLILWRSR